MSDSHYYEQAIPEGCTVLGVTLESLTLGHVVLLHRIGSAFVSEKQADDPFSELAIAVAICRQSFADGIQTLRDPETPKAMRVWAQKLTRTTAADRKAKRKPVSIDIAAEWAKFVAWMQFNSKVPNYSFSPEDFREMGCPSAQMVRAYIQRAFSISDTDIVNRPWSQCLWDYVTLRAIDGRVQMLGDAQEAAIKEAQATADKIAAAIEARGGLNGHS